jgi:hypothetical protein
MAPCLGDRYARVGSSRLPNHTVGKQQEGRRATIKALPTSYRIPKPRLMSIGRAKSGYLPGGRYPTHSLRPLAHNDFIHTFTTLAPLLSE